MKKIYIVVGGEYSDYHIEAVFSTREKAEEYIQQHGTYYRIEVLGVDEVIVDKKNKIWEVSMRFDNFELDYCEPFENEYYALYKDTFRYDTLRHYEKIKQYIEADSMERAVKVASERMAQIKANKDILYSRAFILKRDTTYYNHGTYPMVYYKTGEIMKKP